MRGASRISSLASPAPCPPPDPARPRSVSSPHGDLRSPEILVCNPTSSRLGPGAQHLPSPALCHGAHPRQVCPPQDRVTDTTMHRECPGTRGPHLPQVGLEEVASELLEAPPAEAEGLGPGSEAAAPGQGRAGWAASGLSPGSKGPRVLGTRGREGGRGGSTLRAQEPQTTSRVKQSNTRLHGQRAGLEIEGRAAR